MRVDLSAYSDGQPRVSAVQRSLILKSLPGFSELTGAELAILASFVTERVFRKGETMLEPGRPAMSIFLIIDGVVEMFLDGLSVGTFTNRTSVGGVAALSRDPRGAHAVARSDVFALELDAEEMDELFEDNHNLIVGVLGALARTLRGLQEKQGGVAVSGTVHPDYPTARGLTLVDRMFVLRATENFKDVSIEALLELAEGAHEVSYEAGEQIWRRGSPANHSLMIVSGRVVATPPDADPQPFTSRWIVGGLDDLGHLPRWYDLHAEVDTVALKLSSTNLYDVFEDYPDMGIKMLRGLARGALALQERALMREHGIRSTRPPTQE